MLGSNRPLFSKWNGAKQPAKGELSAVEKVRLMRQFVSQVGGIENARRALDMLAVFKRAA
ncbi:MAG: hypothetical protein AB7O59_20185 [Pirellulales bacterium]